MPQKIDCYLSGIDAFVEGGPTSPQPLAATDQTMDAKLERICDGLVALAASGRRLEERCDAYDRSLRS